MTDYKITGPDGYEVIVTNADLVELTDHYEMVGCIMSLCPDAKGWALTNLTTGNVTDVDKMLAEGY